MKRAFLALLPLLLVLGSLVLVSCEGLVLANEKRVTFALVMDDRTTYTGKTVFADLKLPNPNQPDPLQLQTLESLEDVLENCDNTTVSNWARLTTLEEIPTNTRYALVFYIDMNGDGIRNSGDMSGVQFFDVMPNAIWCETKYFTKDLDTV